MTWAHLLATSKDTELYCGRELREKGQVSRQTSETKLQDSKFQPAVTEAPRQH